MRTRLSFIPVLLFISILYPSWLPAQEGSDGRTHEKFFLRFLAGMGAGNIALDFPESDMVFSAAGGLFHFQIGREISKNLALFVDMGGFSLSDPKLEWQGTSTTLTDTSLNSNSWGIGLSYYIMPVNIYFAGSLMLARTKIKNQDQDLGESKLGPGIFLSIGKEWWIGKRWGLGITGFYEGAWLKDKEDAQGYNASINNQIFGIAITATMF